MARVIAARRSSELTPLQDWINRSTAAGVVQAIRFDQSSAVSSWTHPDGQTSLVTRNASGGIIGDGSLKIAQPTSLLGNGGQWRIPMNTAWTSTTQGIGSTVFYAQYRIKLGTNRLTPSTGGGGFKQHIMGGYRFDSPGSSSSHSDHETVLTNYNWRGIPALYVADALGNTTEFESDNGTGQIILQNAIDNGAGISDPDLRYCRYKGSDPGHSPGCWAYVEQQWNTWYYRVKYVDYGGPGTGNEIDCYVARYGEPSYTQLWQQRNFTIGVDSTYTGGPNGFWFLPYDTGRTGSSVDTDHEYDQLILSTAPIACPVY